MSPITHFLVGWAGLERFQASRRDKALVVLAGLAPDLDGLGIVVDFATRALGLPETDYYQGVHRATRLGYSPVGLLSERGDAVFVATLRGWRQRVLSIFSGGR